MHFGQVALTTPENAGDIANLGVIVGRDAVAVIDTGGSVAVGEALLAAVRAHHGKASTLCHQHPRAPGPRVRQCRVRALGVTFVGHRNLPARLAERGDYYLRSFRERWATRRIERVRIIPPTLLVEDETSSTSAGACCC